MESQFKPYIYLKILEITNLTTIMTDFTDDLDILLSRYYIEECQYSKVVLGALSSTTSKMQYAQKYI